MAKFIQIIEYKTSRIDDIDKMLDEFISSTKCSGLTLQIVLLPLPGVVQLLCLTPATVLNYS